MDHLLHVVTVREAARMWNVNPTTIRRAIDARRRPLEARKSDVIWLISYESLVRRWGLPFYPPCL